MTTGHLRHTFSTAPSLLLAIVLNKSIKAIVLMTAIALSCAITPFAIGQESKGPHDDCKNKMTTASGSVGPGWYGANSCGNFGFPSHDACKAAIKKFSLAATKCSKCGGHNKGCWIIGGGGNCCPGGNPGPKNSCFQNLGALSPGHAGSPKNKQGCYIGYVTKKSCVTAGSMYGCAHCGGRNRASVNNNKGFWIIGGGGSCCPNKPDSKHPIAYSRTNPTNCVWQSLLYYFP